MSAPETCDDVAKRLVEETRHMKFITDPPETPEAVRQAAHIAVGRFLPPSLQREAANIVDAVAPLLEAPLRTEIERLADEYRDEQQRRYAANAEVSRLTQQLAEVESFDIEAFIENLKWSDDAPDIWKTLVAGNLRGLMAKLRMSGIELADTYWDDNDPETGYSSPEDLAESQGWRPGEVHRIRMGRSLPDGWLAIHPDKDGDIGEGTIHATEAEASSALSLEAPRG